MDNHYHLLLELTEANLSRAVQGLNVSYSLWFNRRDTGAAIGCRAGSSRWRCRARLFIFGNFDG